MQRWGRGLDGWGSCSSPAAVASALLPRGPGPALRTSGRIAPRRCPGFPPPRSPAVSPTAGRGRTADRLSRSGADPGDWSLWFAAISRRRCPPRRGCRTAERHCGGRPVGAIRLSRCGPGCQLRAGRLRCVAKSVWGGGCGGQSRPVWADLRDHLHATATREKRPTGRGGDFRDRERIRSWAQAIARELVALPPRAADVRPTRGDAVVARLRSGPSAVQGSFPARRGRYSVEQGREDQSQGRSAQAPPVPPL